MFHGLLVDSEGGDIKNLLDFWTIPGHHFRRIKSQKFEMLDPQKTSQGTIGGFRIVAQSI